ncbi:RNI-like protein [Neocallimastix lanati (nom. inval.)]|uniref:RNI-like protein n=1 Tax=Neocallimastix californiae TaxID=1754190 RepID=A0A1Y2DH74_9FUNG|nr:RNI-like protein [Neocallimastix sp. JGI-2020a]ORY58609.1 RNI-like protein [Neocallimastix californiae]|eukprot:ORY58609.1 RNI-like protein [Neocallimastix californiae]
MKFYKRCYLNLFTIVFTILEMTQNILATDCDTFSKIVKYMGKNVYEDSYVTFTDCCKATGVTCDANKNIVELSFGKFYGYEGSINGFYKELQNLKSLTSLEIVDCKIGDYTQSSTRILPKTIGNIKNLKTLIIKDNYIDYLDCILPEEIGNLINLEKLDLSGNLFTGPIPKSIANLKNLKILNLKHNNFTEEIPYEFKNLQNLEEINLYGNSNLTGYVPKLPKLKSCNDGVSGLCRLLGRSGDYTKLYSSNDIKSINKRNENLNPLENVESVSKVNSSSSDFNTSIYNSTNYNSSGFYSSSFHSSNIDSSTSNKFTNSIFKYLIIFIVAIILFIIIIIVTICMCNKHAKKTKINDHMKHRSVNIFINDFTKSLKPSDNIINDTIPLRLSYSTEDEPLPEYTPTEKPMVMASPESTLSYVPLKNNYSSFTEMNSPMNTPPVVTVPPPTLILSSAVNIPQIIISPPPSESAPQSIIRAPPVVNVPQLIISPPPDESTPPSVVSVPPSESAPPVVSVPPSESESPIVSVPQLIISPPPGESVAQLIVSAPPDESVPQIVVSAPPDESVTPIGYTASSVGYPSIPSISSIN